MARVNYDRGTWNALVAAAEESVTTDQGPYRERNIVRHNSALWICRTQFTALEPGALDSTTNVANTDWELYVNAIDIDLNPMSTNSISNAAVSTAVRALANDITHGFQVGNLIGFSRPSNAALEVVAEIGTIFPATDATGNTAVQSVAAGTTVPLNNSITLMLTTIAYADIRASAEDDTTPTYAAFRREGIDEHIIFEVVGALPAVQPATGVVVTNFTYSKGSAAPASTIEDPSNYFLLSSPIELIEITNVAGTNETLATTVAGNTAAILTKQDIIEIAQVESVFASVTFDPIDDELFFGELSGGFIGPAFRDHINNSDVDEIVINGTRHTFDGTLAASSEFDNVRVTGGSNFSPAITNSTGRVTSYVFVAEAGTIKTLAPGQNATFTRVNDALIISAAGAQDQLTAEQLAVVDANPFTDAEMTKLTGIAEGAEVNVQSDWAATDGDALILNKPDIPIINSDGVYTVGTDNAGTVDLTTAGELASGLATKQNLLEFSSRRIFTASAVEAASQGNRFTFTRESAATQELILDLFNNIDGTSFTLGTINYTFSSVLAIPGNGEVTLIFGGLAPQFTVDVFDAEVVLLTSAMVDGVPNELVAGANIDFTATTPNQITISAGALQPTISYIHDTINFTAQVNGVRASNSDPITISNIVGADIADIITELNDEDLHIITINGIAHVFTGSFGAQLAAGTTDEITTTNDIAVLPIFEENFPTGTAVTISLASENFTRITAGTNIELARDANNDLTISASDDSASDTHDTLEGQLDVRLVETDAEYVVQVPITIQVTLPGDGQSIAEYLPNSRQLRIKASTTSTNPFTVGDLIGNNPTDVNDRWIGRVLKNENPSDFGNQSFSEVRVISGGEALERGRTATSGVYFIRQNAALTGNIPLFTIVGYEAAANVIVNGEVLTWIEDSTSTYGGYWTGRTPVTTAQLAALAAGIGIGAFEPTRMEYGVGVIVEYNGVIWRVAVEVSTFDLDANGLTVGTLVQHSVPSDTNSNWVRHSLLIHEDGRTMSATVRDQISHSHGLDLATSAAVADLVSNSKATAVRETDVHATGAALNLSTFITGNTQMSFVGGGSSNDFPSIADFNASGFTMQFVTSATDAFVVGRSYTTTPDTVNISVTLLDIFTCTRIAKSRGGFDFYFFSINGTARTLLGNLVDTPTRRVVTFEGTTHFDFNWFIGTDPGDLTFYPVFTNNAAVVTIDGVELKFDLDSEGSASLIPPADVFSIEPTGTRLDNGMLLSNGTTGALEWVPPAVEVLSLEPTGTRLDSGILSSNGTTGALEWTAPPADVFRLEPTGTRLDNGILLSNGTTGALEWSPNGVPITITTDLSTITTPRAGQFVLYNGPSFGYIDTSNYAPDATTDFNVFTNIALLRLGAVFDNAVESRNPTGNIRATFAIDFSASFDTSTGTFTTPPSQTTTLARITPATVLQHIQLGQVVMPEGGANGVPAGTWRTMAFNGAALAGANALWLSDISDAAGTTGTVIGAYIRIPTEVVRRGSVVFWDPTASKWRGPA